MSRSLTESPFFARLLPVLLLMALLLSSGSAVLSAPPEYDALLAEFQDLQAERFDGRLIDYDIDIRFRPELGRITGDMTVTFPNFTGQPLDDIAFRLFPNAIYYGEGYLHIVSASVAGVALEPRYDETRTSLFVPLPEPLAPGDETTIELTFRTVIPENSRGTYGIFTHHLGSDTWVLADWHPIVAGWDDDLGWRTDAPTPHGDPTFADIGLYDFTVTLPARYQIIATGIERSAEAVGSDLQRVSIVTGPARDLTLVISDQLVPLEQMAGETIVRVWHYPEPASLAAAEWVLAESVAALTAWGERYGRYPGSELDLVATPAWRLAEGIGSKSPRAGCLVMITPAGSRLGRWGALRGHSHP